MRKLYWLALLCLGLVLGLAGASAAADTPDSAEVAAGKELVQTRCVICHNLDRVHAAMKIKTPEQFRHIVDEMIGKGAKLNPAEKELALKYLTSGQ